MLLSLNDQTYLLSSVEFLDALFLNDADICSDISDILLGYLFREANSFPRGKLEENSELRGTDNVQGQISEIIFAAKLRLL